MNNKLATKQIMEGHFENAFTFEGKEDIVRSVDKLPGGVYAVHDVGDMFRTKLVYMPVVLKEKYVDISDGTVGKVLKKAESFFTDRIKGKYNQLGIAHKTGVLLFGPPGTGKTVTGHIIMHKLVQKYEATCLVINSDTHPSTWKTALRELSHLERPVIFFCDECEKILSSQEQEWLTFLDGHESISNFMWIGCTNYANKIAKRLKRPSRIEHLIEVTSIEEAVAVQYVTEKVNDLGKDVKAAMVHYAMEMGATIDAFKNAVKEYYIYYENAPAKEFEEILRSYIREYKDKND